MTETRDTRAIDFSRQIAQASSRVNVLESGATSVRFKADGLGF